MTPEELKLDELLRLSYQEDQDGRFSLEQEKRLKQLKLEFIKALQLEQKIDNEIKELTQKMEEDVGGWAYDSYGSERSALYKLKR